jgi:hypothetical protein
MSPTNGSAKLIAAPVCPISRSQAAPGMPGTHAPQVPKATDLPSAIAAINQLNTILQTIGIGPPTINNIYPPGVIPPPSGGSSPTSHGGGSSGGTVFKAQDWTEVSRAKTTVQVSNPKDDTQWVRLECISQIIWREQADGSGNYFKYQLGG